MPLPPRVRHACRHSAAPFAISYFTHAAYRATRRSGPFIIAMLSQHSCFGSRRRRRRSITPHRAPQRQSFINFYRLLPRQCDIDDVAGRRRRRQTFCREPFEAAEI